MMLRNCQDPLTRPNKINKNKNIGMLFKNQVTFTQLTHTADFSKIFII